MASVEQIMTVQGCEIHLIKTAVTGDCSLVFLHGMKFNAATWRDLGTMEMLAQNGYGSLALDLPGFGDSPGCEVDPLVVVSQVIAGAGLHRPVLVGPSMGGKIALDIALTHPNLIGGLVLIGAVGVEERKELLSTINVPTLVIWGSEDAISPPAHGHLLAQRIPEASLVFIQGAPHPCYLDQPEIWHWELTNFLAEYFGKALTK